MAKYILAVDHGTSGVKTSIISESGELVDFEYEKTPIYFSDSGGAEQDPADWWNALLNTSRKLIARKAVPPEQIIAVCCSSTFSSTVAVDERGNHLMNSLTWMDSRGAPYIRKVVGGWPSIDGYGVATMLPWIYKTAGGPQLSGKDDIAHVLFVKNKFPEIYDRTFKFMGSKDFLNLKLTGRFAASYDSMMLFWVTNTRDINRMYYDDSLLRKVGVPKDKLPEMKRSIDVLGPLDKKVAADIGLLPDVQVIVGSPDHQSACIGSGAVRDFQGHLYIGTSSWIQCIVPFKKTDMFRSIATLPTSIPGKYYAANEQDIAGGCLGFLVNNILYRKSPLNDAAPPDDIYERLDKAAASVHPGANKLIFCPWLNGERTPVDDTTLRAGIYNMSMRTTAEDVARAFLEGVAFNNKWALFYVERFCGRKLNPLNIIGGGAKSDLWCQIFADVLDREIRRVKDPMQSNARGAAFIALVALGRIKFDDIPNLMKYSGDFKPDPANRKVYDELFSEFLQIYKKNKSIYRRLNS